MLSRGMGAGFVFLGRCCCDGGIVCVFFKGVGVVTGCADGDCWSCFFLCAGGMGSDIAVAAAAAMEEFGLRRILIVDLDVHQGKRWEMRAHFFAHWEHPDAACV